MSNALLRTALGLLLASQLLAGCSLNSMLGGNTEREALAALDWSFESRAIEARVDTAPALNRYDDQAHSLVLMVVQSADADAVRKLFADESALTRALLSGQTPAGLLSVSRYALVEPGRQARFALDRQTKAQYIGVVAAYFGKPLQEGSRLFQIPAEVDKSGLVSSTYSARPARVMLRLRLGADMILQADLDKLPASPAGAPSPAGPPAPEAAIRLDSLTSKKD
ncbi:MAG: type VI secretion lipoprotein TssJ [Moraxellaceae bacterium]|nr:type VI secretion lipoprotein TssJ [Moraxellaceae bacterium]